MTRYLLLREKKKYWFYTEKTIKSKLMNHCSIPHNPSVTQSLCQTCNELRRNNSVLNIHERNAYVFVEMSFLWSCFVTRVTFGCWHTCSGSTRAVVLTQAAALPLKAWLESFAPFSPLPT